MNSIKIKSWCDTQFKNFCSPLDKKRWKFCEIIERIFLVVAAAFGYLIAQLCRLFEKKNKSEFIEIVSPIKKEIPEPKVKSLFHKTPDVQLNHICSYLDPASLEALSWADKNLQGRIQSTLTWNNRYTKIYADLFCKNHFNNMNYIYVEEDEHNCHMIHASKEITKSKVSKIKLKVSDTYVADYFLKMNPNFKNNIACRTLIKTDNNEIVQGMIIIFHTKEGPLKKRMIAEAIFLKPETPHYASGQSGNQNEQYKYLKTFGHFRIGESTKNLKWDLNHALKTKSSCVLCKS